MNTNQITVVGNLARNPEVKGTQSGKTWARFTLAANRQNVNKETGEVKGFVDYVSCVAWGRAATAMNSFIKGDPLIVVGRFTSRSYEDQQGQKHYVQEITADVVGSPLGYARRGEGRETYSQSAPAPQTGAQGGNFGQFGNAHPDPRYRQQVPQPQYQQSALGAQPTTAYVNPNDEDIPF